MNWPIIIKNVAAIGVLILTGALAFGLVLLVVWIFATLPSVILVGTMFIAICLLLGICIWTLLPDDFVTRFDERFHLK